MKKRISLLSVILLLVLSLAGCGGTENKETPDKETLESYAQYALQICMNMDSESKEQFKALSDLELNLTLVNNGFPMEGSNFLTMLEGWDAAVEECGAFIELGASEMEVKSDETVLSYEAIFADRDATIEFVFDKNENIESMTVGAKYSIGEILKKAGLNTVLGMGTVFVVLIFIAFIISLFKYIPDIQKKFGKKNKTDVPAAPAAIPAQAVQSVQEDVTDDSELIAVIAAAIAASEGTSTDGFVVRSIKRRKSNKWN
ncbi:MAG: OadG family transporter subunit [Schaedlerella sp.]|nr:OadG family protein [Lachnospiraceae bacterium]MDY4203196.1 OadG family transporter subunit [Schaedlerella sp.]